MKQDLIRYINSVITKQASTLRYTVSTKAPSNEIELFNAPSLVIWSGASEGTIFNDASVNYAFRALHDTLHLTTRLNFSPDNEIELGRIQASKYTSDLMRELVYAEVSLQAKHYKLTGQFVSDQAAFTMRYLQDSLKLR